MLRRSTKKIKIGSRAIGGNLPILVQSMCNTDPSGFAATLAQIRALEEAGCDIIRLSIPDKEAVHVLSKLKEVVQTPLVADIHFNYKLAIEAAFAGADKIRINPGNLGGIERLKLVADACREKKIPIRVGVNAGSLEKELLAKYGKVCAPALKDSVLSNVRLLEALEFEDLVLSVKASSVPMMIEANRLIAAECHYPLHLGVTEAGTIQSGAIKNAVGIGSLLCDGIGDTIRVSLTADPVQEVKVARLLLSACGRAQNSIDVISCPTCGRTKISLQPIAEELEKRIEKAHLSPTRNLKVAVMGCAVNGPGEAADADIGIAGGEGEALLFKKGQSICKIPQEHIVDRLFEELCALCAKLPE